MHEMTAGDYSDVGGGFAPLAGVGLAISLIGNSSALYDFFSGVFDGFHGMSRQ